MVVWRWITAPQWGGDIQKVERHQNINNKKKQTSHIHTNALCVCTTFTSSLLEGMINPGQSKEILTLNSKVLLRLQEALIYVGTPPSTLIIPMQVQAQIPHPPAVAAC